MKKTIYQKRSLFVCCCLFIALNLAAQNVDKKLFDKKFQIKFRDELKTLEKNPDGNRSILIKKKHAELDSIGNGKVGDTYSVFIGSMTIPVDAVRLQFGDTSSSINPSINLAYGYGFNLGRATITEDDVQISTGISFGAAVSGGVTVEANTGTIKGSLGISGFVGFNRFVLMVGYDFLVAKPYIGLATKVDMFSTSRRNVHLFERKKKLFK